MGEKGNLLDMGPDIFANLAEQGPQFWLGYEQYKLSRARSAQAGAAAGEQAPAVAERDVPARDAAATQPAPPAAG